eukprot:TRINITY_DN67689_c11_g3_i1.p1 TRINITY_DN67689_c11_g3~~TRINITY_DN67689_c11_g3_i1.p1  ORF type:complete len:187 (-),score=10.60 TRINITY_DN67689_c11_g3_i1:197-757(-)
MGGTLTKMLDKLSAMFTREARILMLGLDAAGKTTILYKLRLNELVQTLPTIGFNVETVQYKKINFMIWDVGGQDKLRRLWKHYFENIDALIYVVDTNDRARIDIAGEELQRLMKEPALAEATLLVLANKQDLPQAYSVSEVVQKLGLPSLKDRVWNAQPTCALTGEGLYEGLDWLSTHLPKKSIVG